MHYIYLFWGISTVTVLLLFVLNIFRWVIYIKENKNEIFYISDFIYTFTKTNKEFKEHIKRPRRNYVFKNRALMKIERFEEALEVINEALNKEPVNTYLLGYKYQALVMLKRLIQKSGNKSPIRISTETPLRIKFFFPLIIFSSPIMPPPSSSFLNKAY